MYTVVSEYHQGDEYTVGINDERFEEAADRTNEHLALVGPQYFYDAASSAQIDHQTGMRHALMPPSPTIEVSTEAALVVPGSFGNDLWPHRLAMGMTLADEGFRLGMRDRSGNPLGALLLSAPSLETTYRLGVRGICRTNSGDFLPVGRLHTDLMLRLGFGVVKGIVANSQAAALAPAMVRAAGFDGMDVDGNTMLVERPLRSRLGQACGFYKEGQRLMSTVRAEGVEVLDQIFGVGSRRHAYEKGLARRGLHSMALFRGLGSRPHAALCDDLVLMGSLLVPTTVVSGAESFLSHAGDTSQVVRAANQRLSGDYRRDASPIGYIEVLGGTHALGDRLGRLRELAGWVLTALPAEALDELPAK